METELWRAVCTKSTCTVRREGRVTTVPTPICAIKRMSRSNLSSRRRGGAKRKPDRAQPQEKIGEIFRPEEFRRTDHPVCGASEASRLFINAAATPPFQGGECVSLPIHSHVLALGFRTEGLAAAEGRHISGL